VHSRSRVGLSSKSRRLGWAMETEVGISIEAHWRTLVAELSKGYVSREVFQQRSGNNGYMSVDDWLGLEIVVKHKSLQ
jgi:hypothetical protein